MYVYISTQILIWVIAKHFWMRSMTTRNSNIFTPVKNVIFFKNWFYSKDLLSLVAKNKLFSFNDILHKDLDKSNSGTRILNNSIIWSIYEWAWSVEKQKKSILHLNNNEFEIMFCLVGIKKKLHNNLLLSLYLQKHIAFTKMFALCYFWWLIT